MPKVKPTILFIDDNVEHLAAHSRLANSKGVNSSVKSPAELTEDHLKRADLVVVDYTLDDWPERDEVNSITLMPLDGIALAGILRRRSQLLHQFPPTAYALITGQPQALGPIPAEPRPHVISRLNNLEWFFEKSENTDVLVDQIISLATGVKSLPESVRESFSDHSKLVRFLGVDDLDSNIERYVEAVQRCRPPINYLAQRSHGLVIIRWLLHRILPHTTFLIDSLHLAARLQITPLELTNLISSRKKVAQQFKAVRYLGPLSEFDGPRWWRDGVEQVLWDGTNGESSNPTSIWKFLNTPEAEQVNVDRPVVTLNDRYQPEPIFSAYRDVQAIRLDDWPDYAEPAYRRK